MANSIRGLGSCDDLAVGPAEGPNVVAGRAARPGLGGVVPRPGLFERLGASARGPSVLGTDRLISVRATDAPGCGAGAGSSHA